MSHSRLLSLPDELLLEILSELDVFSLLRSTEVCHVLRSFVKPSTILQYKVQLTLAGMKDGPPTSEGSSSRLRRLETHQAAWHDLQWSSKQTFSLNDVRLWELAGGVLGLVYAENIFNFTRLPSSLRGMEQKEWKVEVDKNFDLLDFSMDVSNDLLVVLRRENAQITVHLLSLSTGKPHSKTATPILTCLVDVDHVGSTFDIRIFGQNLGVLFDSVYGTKSELFIWNWQTGTQYPSHSFIFLFAFLTENLVLLNPVPRRPHIYPGSTIIDLKKPDNPVFLFLPKLREDVDLESVETHCESVNPQNDDVPFTSSTDDRLFVIIYRLFDDNGDMESYALFLPLSTILSAIANSHLHRPYRYRLFEEWAAKRCRLMQLDVPEVWVCYVHGMKAAIYDKTLCKTRIFDFNQFALRYDLAQAERPKDWEYLTEESVISSFSPVVHTSLRGRVRSVSLQATTDAVMLAEDSLMAIHDEGEDDKEDAVVVFSF
ncbi:hypothetical protein D9758_001091 [Tetrapyrgos nigripes]|uniref:F-box domain-containing protein n=1 Tax=Tetrapyrgos nigripes TaxID=182062 RepID=A0A8H5LUD8_9AGAR|nr:hypothetical protein D9758_001091 [Tetrapyrgos nigripes]